MAHCPHTGDVAPGIQKAVAEGQVETSKLETSCPLLELSAVLEAGAAASGSINVGQQATTRGPHPWSSRVKVLPIVEFGPQYLNQTTTKGW